VGVSSTVGTDTLVHSPQEDAHCFIVEVLSAGELTAEQKSKVKAIVEIQKPAHRKVIRNAIYRFVEPCEVREAAAAPARAEPPAPRRPQPFQGGPLAFTKDRITLCGVTVITDKGTGQAMMMLAELAKKERGRFVRRSAEDLKKAIGADSVQDVLVRDGQGYHLQDWIEVGEAAGEEEEPPREALHTETGPEGTPENAPAEAESMNERQCWVVEHTQGGQNVRRTDLEAEFRVSSKTAKRDLEALARAGRVEFVRKPHPGFYRGKRV
jgi:hypothetical protein